MEKISTLFLRRELTRVIDRLVAGESFLVTHRGKIIGALQPIGFQEPMPPGPSPIKSVRAQLDAVSPSVQTGQTGKISTTRAASKQTLRDEILRGVRTGRQE